MKFILVHDAEPIVPVDSCSSFFGMVLYGGVMPPQEGCHMPHSYPSTWKIDMPLNCQLRSTTWGKYFRQWSSVSHSLQSSFQICVYWSNVPKLFSLISVPSWNVELWYILVCLFLIIFNNSEWSSEDMCSFRRQLENSLGKPFKKLETTSYSCLICLEWIKDGSEDTVSCCCHHVGVFCILPWEITPEMSLLSSSTPSLRPWEHCALPVSFDYTFYTL